MRILITLFAYFCVSCHSAHILATPQTKYSIDIPAGYRHDSLLLLAYQTNHEILFDISRIPNKHVPAVHGIASLEEALTQLLRESDITYAIHNKQMRVSVVVPSVFQLPAISVHEYLRDRGVIHNDDSQESFPLFHLPLSVRSVFTDLCILFNTVEYTDLYHREPNTNRRASRKATFFRP